MRDCCRCLNGGAWLFMICRACMTTVWLLLVPAWDSKIAVRCLECVKTAWLVLCPLILADCCLLLSRWCCLTKWCVGMHAKTGHHCVADAADIGTEAVWPTNWCLTAVGTAWLLLLSQWGSLTIVCCMEDVKTSWGAQRLREWCCCLPGTACVQSVVWSACLMLLLQ